LKLNQQNAGKTSAGNDRKTLELDHGITHENPFIKTHNGREGFSDFKFL